MRSTGSILLAALATAQQPDFGPYLEQMSFPTVPSSVLYGINQNFGARFSRSPVRSDDGGLNWIPLYVFEPGSLQNIAQVVVQPDNPTIVYAATTMDRGGVWKSVDSGRTWVRASSGLPSGSALVQNLTAMNSEPQALFARIGDGVYRTLDGGGSWSRAGALPANATAVGMGRQRPLRLYTMSRGGQIYRSDDEGATWNLGMLFAGVSNIEATEIIVNPSMPEIAYVSTIEPGATFCFDPAGDLYQTLNGGASWRQLYRGACNGPPSIRIDSRTPTLFIHWSLSSCRSPDRGETLDCSGSKPRVVDVDPRNSEVYAANGRLKSTDLGVAFLATNAVLRASLPRYTSPVEFQVVEGAAVTQKRSRIPARRSVPHSLSGDRDGRHLAHTALGTRRRQRRLSGTD